MVLQVSTVVSLISETLLGSKLMSSFYYTKAFKSVFHSLIALYQIVKLKSFHWYQFQSYYFRVASHSGLQPCLHTTNMPLTYVLSNQSTGH